MTDRSSVEPKTIVYYKGNRKRIRIDSKYRRNKQMIMRNNITTEEYLDGSIGGGVRDGGERMVKGCLRMECISSTERT